MALRLKEKVSFNICLRESLSIQFTIHLFYHLTLTYNIAKFLKHLLQLNNIAFVEYQQNIVQISWKPSRFAVWKEMFMKSEMFFNKLREKKTMNIKFT